MVRIVAAGHVNWDVTLRVDALPEPDGEARIQSQQTSGGGSAANVAAALAGFGESVGLVGSVGDDEHGHLARRELEALDVDLAHLLTVPGVATTVKYLIVAADGEVMVLGNDGANERVAPGDVDSDYIADAEHLHLTSQRPDTAARLAEVAADAGVSVSFDPGRRLLDHDYSATLDRTDVVFLNDREARAILDDAYEYAGSALDDRILVVKHGDEGAEVHTPDGSYEHPGFDIDPLDSTGAGDAFAAGFIRVYLDAGDVELALEVANACGALTTQGEGARCAPTGDELDAFLAAQFSE
ncbi:carbohydrate kinase family protein [Halobacteriaceae archaeon GCM10025711]